MDYHTGEAEMDKELDARFAILAPQVQSLISGDAVDRIAEGVMRRYNLTEEECDAIGNELVLILMYIEPVDNLFENLVAEDLIDPVVAEAVVDIAQRELFLGIESQLGTRKELDAAEAKAAEPTLNPAGTPNDPRAPVAVTISPENFKPITAPLGGAPASTPLPPLRVMPHSEAEANAQIATPNKATELPNTLLRNLQASLAHSAAEKPYVEEPTPKASYNSMLEKRPPIQ